MGWETFTPQMLEMVEKHPRIVMVYPHNSMYDFWISMFLIREHTLLRRRTRTMVNRKFMQLPVIGPFLEQWNCITGSGSVKGMGTLDSLVQQLDSMEEFILPISPKGDIAARPWRSGYYQIAKQTGAYVLAAGFDYHRHRFTLGVPFQVGEMSPREVEMRCKSEMAHIPSLNLQHHEFPHHQQLVPLQVSGFSRQAYVRNIWILVGLLVFLVLLLIVISPRSNTSGKD